MFLSLLTRHRQSCQLSRRPVRHPSLVVSGTERRFDSLVDRGRRWRRSWVESGEWMSPAWAPSNCIRRRIYKDVETSKCIDSETSVHLWRWQRAAAAAAWLNGNQTIYPNKITSRFLSSSLLPGTTVEIKLSEKTFTRILCQNVYVCAR